MHTAKATSDSFTPSPQTPFKRSHICECRGSQMEEDCILSFSDWDGWKIGTLMTSSHGSSLPVIQEAKLFIKRLLSKHGIKKTIMYTQLFLPMGFPSSGLSPCPPEGSFPTSKHQLGCHLLRGLLKPVTLSCHLIYFFLGTPITICHFTCLLSLSFTRLHEANKP